MQRATGVPKKPGLAFFSIQPGKNGLNR